MEYSLRVASDPSAYDDAVGLIQAFGDGYVRQRIINTLGLFPIERDLGLNRLRHTCGPRRCRATKIGLIWYTTLSRRC